MKVIITGSSGFVGQELKSFFIKEGHEVYGVRRETLSNLDKLQELVDGADIVINLSGANIINRWTDKYKQELYESRINTTSLLIEAFNRVKNKPKTFISTSAVGIYNNKSRYDEDQMEYAKDFLGNLCIDWEAKALEATDLGIRTIIFRYGIVLGKKGGAFKQMLLPFKLGLGGIIGNGKQSFSYIHIDDLIHAYLHIVKNVDLEGIFNLTSPNPTTNEKFTKSLGKSLKRPTILPIPEFILEFIFSEGATVLTNGQEVIPKRLLDSGFNFQFDTIEKTIENLIK